MKSKICGTMALLYLFASILLLIKPEVLHADTLEKRVVKEEFEKNFDNYEHLNHEYGDPTHLQSLNPSVIRFVKEIAKPANESATNNGVYASVIIAQAILESGSGESGLSLSPYNNLFGVKGGYNGNTISVPTFEYADGERYETTANFAVYPDWATSIEAHGELMRGLNGFYHGAWLENTDSYEDATAFLQGRYATDINYTSKLNALIANYNLSRFDQMDFRDELWLQSDSTDPFEKAEIKSEDRNLIKDEILKASVVHQDELQKVETQIDPMMSANERLDVTYINTRLNQRGFNKKIVDWPSQLKRRYKGAPQIGDLVVISNDKGETVGFVESRSGNTITISRGKMMGYKVIGIYEELNVDDCEFIVI